MAIEVRPVRSAGDYAAWRQVRLAVVPYERTDSVESLRVQAGPQREFLLAEMDGVLAGSGLVGKSDLAGAGGVAARVLPDMRRLGIGTEILRVLAGRAAAMGFDVVNSHADDPGSVRFAERYGFREGMCPVSEDASARTLALQFFTGLEQSTQERVAEVLASAL